MRQMSKEIKVGNVLVHKSKGKNYQWKKKKVLYRKEYLTIDIRRIFNNDYREYELAVDGSFFGYICEAEDGTYTPYYEKYDHEGRLIESIELHDASCLNTAVARIIRKKKGHRKYDNIERTTS